MADGEDADTQLRTGGFELAVGGGGGSGRVLGSRQLARYYRQSYRPSDPRRSVAVASVLAQCATAWHALNGYLSYRMASYLVEAAFLDFTPQESHICALCASCHLPESLLELRLSPACKFFWPHSVAAGLLFTLIWPLQPARMCRASSTMGVVGRP